MDTLFVKIGQQSMAEECDRKLLHIIMIVRKNSVIVFTLYLYTVLSYIFPIVGRGTSIP